MRHYCFYNSLNCNWEANKDTCHTLLKSNVKILTSGVEPKKNNQKYRGNYQDKSHKIVHNNKIVEIIKYLLNK